MPEYTAMVYSCVAKEGIQGQFVSDTNCPILIQSPAQEFLGLLGYIVFNGVIGKI
jgi:hypothetical protein